MNSTVKYTDDTRDSRKLEWKIRKDTVGYNMPRIHWILRHLTQLKSDLHGKRFSDLNELRTESDLKKGWVIYTENGFNDTGIAYNTRESILRNCAVHRIDDVILSFDVTQTAP